MTDRRLLHDNQVPQVTSDEGVAVCGEDLSRHEALSSICSSLLEIIGENPTREGLLKTPSRFAAAIQELCAGYQSVTADIVNGAVFEEAGDGIVVVSDIPFFSLCEHHVLPFFGSFSVAYRPAGRIIGLSKIPRLVDAFARRLQVQERLTDEVAGALDEVLKPHSVVCRAHASHLCSMMRGAKSGQSKMMTLAMRGLAKTDLGERRELVALLS